MNLRPLAFAALALGACRVATPAPLTLLVPPEHEALARAAVRFVPLDGLAIETATEPRAALRRQSGLAIAWEQDDSCRECFTLRRDGQRVTVSAGGPLGMQYGLYAVLEELGFRFHHPWKTHAPETLVLPERSTAFDRLQLPETERRGLHLHTLHPIEALYDFWMPSEAGLEGALRTLDFLVKNRGNQLMWFGLDDIQRDPASSSAPTHSSSCRTSTRHTRRCRRWRQAPR